MNVTNQNQSPGKSELRHYFIRHQAEDICHLPKHNINVPHSVLITFSHTNSRPFLVWLTYNFSLIFFWKDFQCGCHRFFSLVGLFSVIFSKRLWLIVLDLTMMTLMRTTCEKKNNVWRVPTPYPSALLVFLHSFWLVYTM